ncbi:unnamed protein product [Adineta ricciae]|nr:unnamed protein product [Adineta ricciae]
MLNLYQNVFDASATRTHFHIAELWVGRWMVKDFHEKFTCASHVMLAADGLPRHHAWTEERVVFTAILISTYLFSPIGLLLYFLAVHTYFERFASTERIDWRNPQNLKMKKIVSAVDYGLLSMNNVRFGDSLPENLRKLYRTIRGLVGAVMGLTVLSFFAIYVVYCSIFHRTKLTTTPVKPRGPPQSVRVRTMLACWKSTITPIEQRDWKWKLESYWLQICTFIIFVPCGINPLALFRALQAEFSASLGGSSSAGFFPFGDGIGVGSHKYVKAYLQSRDPLVMKDYQSLGWSVSSSLIKYCSFTHIFFPNPSEPTHDRYLLSRKVIHQWLAAFPHTLTSLKDSWAHKNTATYRYLFRIVPRQPNSEPNKDMVFLAVGETLFFLATGGSLTSDERIAYLDCVKNPFTFLPDWFNFLVAGNYMENIGYASYGKIQAAFARHVHGSALQAAFEAAGDQMTRTEVIQLVTSAFCLGAAPAPAKITADIVHRLWSDQTYSTTAGKGTARKEKMVDVFYENPRNFIKETARLYPVLPMVSVLSNEKIARDVKTHTGADIPPNTRVHCSLFDANTDPNEFTSPNEFNPRRSSAELGKIMSWNGAEGDIEADKEEMRPPRYCPGHNLSLSAMEFVASRFAPVVTTRSAGSQDLISSESSELPVSKTMRDAKVKTKIPPNVDDEIHHPDDDESEVVIIMRELFCRKHLDFKRNKYYFDSLDGYTRLIMRLSKLALSGWNAKPPRAIDIPEPANLPAQELHIQRINGGRYVATWDEDDKSTWHCHTKLINKILNASFWPLEDHDLQFNSVEDMISWRCTHFPSMPPPNNPQWYGDSDELMSRFAFFGLACHHTRKLQPNIDSMELYTATLRHPILKSARYVNDMTGLSLFAVRAPFERYGAAAYFDGQRRLIGIYLSERNELIMPLRRSRGFDNDWTYAKYMWRSSALAMVTISDHLLTTHFIEANTLATVSRQCLPAAHPLRVFLKPFTYRTVTINYSAATSLVSPGGLCHRIWGFEYDEFLKVCDYVIAHYRFRTMPDWIPDSMKLENNRRSKTVFDNHKCADKSAQEYAGIPKCPGCGYDLTKATELQNGFHEDSETSVLSDVDEEESEWIQNYPIAKDLPAFWKVVRDYVKRFFEIEYGKEAPHHDDQGDDVTSQRPFMNEPCEQRFISELCKPLGLNGIPSRAFLIDVITQLICACTGIHEHVGHVGDYLYDPSFIGTKLRRDLPSMLPSVQNFSLMLVLTVLTALRMPGLMEDWSHLIPPMATDNQDGALQPITTEDQVQSHLDNYHLFKHQLTELMEQIDARHHEPGVFPFESFNPGFMECSVSV